MWPETTGFDCVPCNGPMRIPKNFAALARSTYQVSLRMSSDLSAIYAEIGIPLDDLPYASSDLRPIMEGVASRDKNVIVEASVTRLYGSLFRNHLRAEMLNCAAAMSEGYRFADAWGLPLSSRRLAIQNGCIRLRIAQAAVFPVDQCVRLTPGYMPDEVFSAVIPFGY